MAASRRGPAILGLILWGVTCFQTTYVVCRDLDVAASWPRAVAWLVAFTAYGGALLLGLRGNARERTLVIVASVAGLTMTALATCYLNSLLLAVVAWQAGLAFSVRRAVLVVAAQAALGLLVMWLGGQDWNHSTTHVILVGMGLSMALVASGEARARQALERANAELAATRDELAEQTRAAERGRIARELHDAIGHHLAALSLQLEAASHQTQGPGREAVVRSQTLARALLGDVRNVVSACRAGTAVDVPVALRELIDGLERPRAHLALRGDLTAIDPAFGHTIVRCVQEMITNVLKHAAAENVWIEVARLPDRIEAKVSDDGRGDAHEEAPAGAAAGGLGLAGMTERLAQVGGELDIVRPPDGGWTVVARLPLAFARAA